MPKTFIGYLRRKATESEKAFYHLTKDLGLNMVFQKMFKRENKGHYYVDFRFMINKHQIKTLRNLGHPVKSNKAVKHRLLVEIDGEYHNQQQAYDFQREQEILTHTGNCLYHFLRFTNNQVLCHPAEVQAKLYAMCKSLWGIDLQYKTVQEVLTDTQQQPIKRYDF